MLNLICNEQMKTYRRAQTWVMAILLVGLVIVMSLMMNDSAKKDWRTHAQETIQLYSQGDMMDKPGAKEQVALLEARLERDMPPAPLWEDVKQMSSLVLLITVFTVVVAADSVAGEFGGGTIKMLLIRPIRRWKILLSKYISSFLFCFAMLVLLFATSILCSMIAHGFDFGNLVYLDLNSQGEVVESNILSNIFASYGLELISLIMIVTMAFMISTLFRGSSMAIGISLFVLFAGNSVTMILRKFEWSKYLLFPNMNLRQYISGPLLYEGTTVGFSLLILAAYFIVFNVVAWTVFSKRDVAN